MKVEIKGHGVLTGNSDVMNFISLALFKAAEMYKSQGADALAEEAAELSDEIYDQLEANGYYGA